MTNNVSEYGLACSHVRSIPNIQRNPPQAITAVISRTDIDVRVSKMTPDLKEKILATLRETRREPIPFHPLILVFSTGKVSTNECVPMPRAPMPPTGAAFSNELPTLLREAVRLNPSVHDGAVIFSRESAHDEYRLASWSMRIVSKTELQDAVPNLGSAHNSALALSLSSEVDICCLLSERNIAVFQRGSMEVEAIDSSTKT